MSKLTPLTASFTYGRVTVIANMPVRVTDYLRSRKFQCHPIIISADMSCDDDSYPVYYLKATYTTRPIVTSHKLENISTWNVTNYNITVRQMRELLIEMLPLVAALKHYTHVSHDDSKLVNAAHAINACIIHHMVANATVKETYNV